MKILRLTFVLSFWFLIFISYSQVPNWEWIKSAKGPGLQEGTTVATDIYNNVYITGGYGGDSMVFANIALTNGIFNNNSLFFLAKYSTTGEVIWARGATIGESYGVSIGTDKNASVILSGGYIQLINFDNTHALTGNQDIFIVKYDSLGNVIWTASSSSAFSAELLNMAIDPTGNIYITGFFQGPYIAFGSDTLDAANNTAFNQNGAQSNYFLAKYSPTGTVLWAKGIVAPCDTQFVFGSTVTTDNYNNVYVSGTYISDSIVIGSVVLYGPNYGDYEFLAKYDSLGTLSWVKRYGPGLSSTSIGIDRDHNIYATGSFVSINEYTGYSDNPQIGPYTLYSANPTTDIGNFLIVKYDNSGNVLWAKSASTSGVQLTGYSLAINQNNDVFVSGSFYDSISFDSTTTLTQPNNDSLDPMFIVSFDPDGKVICAASLPSGGDDQNGIALDNLGHVYVGGDFASNVFVKGVDSVTLSNPTEEYMFIAKYNCDIKLTGIETISTSPITIYPNPSTGSFYFSGVKESSEIEVYDMMGRNTTSSRPSPKGEGGTAVVDLSGRAAGMYFYRVTERGAVVQQGKLVVE